jgi:RimJ/RimL family protein N-acetyltransferase
VDAVFAYRQLPEVARYLLDEPLSRDAVTQAVQARIGQGDFAGEGSKIFLAVELEDTGRLVGEMSLLLRDRASRQGEIGYIVHPEVQGRGLATEAAGALLGLGFERLGLHRIYACCAAANVPSMRVMERLGMRREAHFREHVMIKGHWDEELVYALLEEEWRGMQAQAAGEIAVQS